MSFFFYLNTLFLYLFHSFHFMKHYTLLSLSLDAYGLFFSCFNNSNKIIEKTSPLIHCAFSIPFTNCLVFYSFFSQFPFIIYFIRPLLLFTNIIYIYIYIYIYVFLLQHSNQLYISIHIYYRLIIS